MRLYICFVFFAAAVASVVCQQDRYVDLGTVHCKVGCACSQDYRPICANDRRTYANECTLRCKQCDIPSLRAVFVGRCEDHLLLAPVPYSYYTQPQYVTAPAPIPVSASAAPAPIPVSASAAPAPTPNTLLTILPQWYYRPRTVVQL